MSLEGEFFGRVGHDLRGELSTILAGVHYLLRYEKRLESGPREMLERVSGAGERLRRLLDEFDNAVWLFDGSRQSLLLAPCVASDLTRGAEARLADAAAAQGVTLSVRTEAAPALQGDEQLLGVALDYVIDFAMRRSRNQPVLVTATTTAEGAPAITVADEAGPLSPEQLARLFVPFGERDAIRHDPATPRRRERLGLGLSIADQILRAHGGGLRAELRPGDQGLLIECRLAASAGLRDPERA